MKLPLLEVNYKECINKNDQVCNIKESNNNVDTIINNNLCESIIDNGSKSVLSHQLILSKIKQPHLQIS